MLAAPAAPPDFLRRLLVCDFRCPGVHQAGTRGALRFVRSGEGGAIGNAATLRAPSAPTACVRRRNSNAIVFYKFRQNMSLRVEAPGAFADWLRDFFYVRCVPGIARPRVRPPRKRTGVYYTQIVIRAAGVASGERGAPPLAALQRPSRAPAALVRGSGEPRARVDQHLRGLVKTPAALVDSNRSGGG